MKHRYGEGHAWALPSRVWRAGEGVDAEAVRAAAGPGVEVEVVGRAVICYGSREVLTGVELAGYREVSVLGGCSGMSNIVQVLTEDPLPAEERWGNPLLERLRSGFSESDAIEDFKVEKDVLYLVFKKNHIMEMERLEKRSFRYNFPGVFRCPGMRLSFRVVRNEVDVCDEGNEEEGSEEMVSSAPGSDHNLVEDAKKNVICLETPPDVSVVNDVGISPLVEYEPFGSKAPRMTLHSDSNIVSDKVICLVSPHDANEEEDIKNVGIVALVEHEQFRNKGIKMSLDSTWRLPTVHYFVYYLLESLDKTPPNGIMSRSTSTVNMKTHLPLLLDSSNTIKNPSISISEKDTHLTNQQHGSSSDALKEKKHLPPYKNPKLMKLLKALLKRNKSGSNIQLINDNKTEQYHNNTFKDFPSKKIHCKSCLMEIENKSCSPFDKNTAITKRKKKDGTLKPCF
eukprot:TRINITY_DN9073_c0_g1_i1.p1 TRINITY_DN9073_c0_g1~~TRINITY_DN9073_c0_g1_i1.p1  ORF type:complete len:525 (-),score=119.50 TRINITY_DN9073_c0_g1_i1:241-1602(-)